MASVLFLQNLFLNSDKTSYQLKGNDFLRGRYGAAVTHILVELKKKVEPRKTMESLNILLS